MKKKKIKWGNVCKAIIFLFCIGLILHDLYMLTIHSWITNELCSWTWLGLTTFLLAIITAGVISEDFEEKNKNIQSYQPQHAKDIK